MVRLVMFRRGFFVPSHNEKELYFDCFMIWLGKILGFDLYDIDVAFF